MDIQKSTYTSMFNGSIFSQLNESSLESVVVGEKADKSHDMTQNIYNQLHHSGHTQSEQHMHNAPFDRKKPSECNQFPSGDGLLQFPSMSNVDINSTCRGSNMFSSSSTDSANSSSTHPNNSPQSSYSPQLDQAGHKRKYVPADSMFDQLFVKDSSMPVSVKRSCDEHSSWPQCEADNNQAIPKASAFEKPSDVRGDSVLNLMNNDFHVDKSSDVQNELAQEISKECNQGAAVLDCFGIGPGKGFGNLPFSEGRQFISAMQSNAPNFHPHGNDRAVPDLDSGHPSSMSSASNVQHHSKPNSYAPSSHGNFEYQNSSSSQMDSTGTRRKNATRESTATLKAWLQEHMKNPYPTKGEKIMLAIITKMTLTQVSTWFANARRRLKKENKMTWTPRNRGEESLDGKSDADYSKHQIEQHLDDDYQETREGSLSDDQLDDHLSTSKDTDDFKSSQQTEPLKSHSHRNPGEVSSHPWFDREYLNWTPGNMNQPEYNSYNSFPMSRGLNEPLHGPENAPFPHHNMLPSTNSHPNNNLKIEAPGSFGDFTEKQTMPNYPFFNNASNHYYYDLLQCHNNQNASQLTEPQPHVNSTSSGRGNLDMQSLVQIQRASDLSQGVNNTPFYNNYRSAESDNNQHLQIVNGHDSFYPPNLSNNVKNVNQNEVRLNNPHLSGALDKGIKQENLSTTGSEKISFELLDSTSSPNSGSVSSPCTSSNMLSDKKPIP